MPIQITYPISQVAKKAKKVFPELHFVVKDNAIHLYALNESATCAMIVKDIGVNIGEKEERITLHTDDIAKIDAIKMDIDTADSGLKITYLTKSGVEVEKEISSLVSEAQIDIIDRLVDSTPSGVVKLRSKELRDALEEIESDEIIRLRLDGDVVVLSGESVSKKSKARIKPMESSGDIDVLLPKELLEGVIEIASSLSTEIELGVVEGGIVKITNPSKTFGIFVAPVAGQ